jgi:hypothetical protein
MTRKSLLISAAFLALLLLVVVARPSGYEVRREVLIAAPPSAVFAQLDSLQRWEAWAPWLSGDPKPTLRTSGPPRGVGAALAWAGDEHVGEGTLTITESQAPELLAVQVSYVRPADDASHSMRFTLLPVGTGTLLAWVYRGRHTLSAQVASLVVDAKHFIGRDLNEGLGALKAAVEAETKAAETIPDTIPAATPEASADEAAAPTAAFDAGATTTAADAASR